jgi:hypothetical protein
MSTTNGTSDWYTKTQVAEILAVSTKTVEKLAGDGKLQQQTVPRQGKPPIVMFHPGDVQREREARNPDGQMFIMPAAADRPDVAKAMVGTLAAIAEKVSSPAALPAAPLEREEPETAELPPSELRWKLFLTEREAVRYTGLGAATLRRRVKPEPIGPNGANVYRRADLDGF